MYGVSLFSFGNIENVKSVPVTLKKIKISMNEMTNAFCSCRTLWYNIKKLVSQNSFDSLRTPLERTVWFRICQIYLRCAKNRIFLPFFNWYFPRHWRHWTSFSRYLLVLPIQNANILKYVQNTWINIYNTFIHSIFFSINILTWMLNIWYSVTN